MIRTELSLRLPNSPGALAAVCRSAHDRWTVRAEEAERAACIALTDAGAPG